MALQSFKGLVIPEGLKLTGFAVVVGAAFFASGNVRIALFVGGVLLALGYLWAKLVA